ncbi:T9SS type A sorting domain-containing protein, partial [bacterium]|nr:T9SS type A sorting domain-containing protein [bacterium]
TLTIYNLLGQQVTQLIDKQHQPGSYTISWNASHLPSGLYFCRMQAGGFTQVRKLILLK